MVLQLLLPTQSLTWQNITKFMVKTTQGTITLLDHHIPLVTSIIAQTISFKDQQQQWQFNISDGLLMFDKHEIKIWLSFAIDIQNHD